MRSPCSVDESYREAKRMIDTGLVGQPFLIKSSTNDQYDPSGELPGSYRRLSSSSPPQR